ncbi:trypsin alpha-3-like [Anopheles nili]|uniref:trypsin alpha-3-like n=1 Tax=Anopheles nili TaxID=185578 RepID=UPI00237BE4E1|nr:trypsin alpha-3-like [Anopheles nili]
MKRLIINLLLCVTSALANSNATEIWRSKQVRKAIKSSFQLEPSVSSRIVGGTEANIKDLPFQLSLRWDGFHICGASVIDSSFAITAAHCVNPMPPVESITLKGGSSNRTDDNGVIFEVEEIIVHPMFNANNYHNDVALVRIVGSFTGYENIHPITLQHVPTLVLSSNQTSCSVHGWGLTSNQSYLPEMLRMVRVPLVPYTDCRRKWSPLSVTASMICAGELRRDSCMGDSGGPLVCNNRLYGIVSWGDNQCGSAYPGVYTNISSKDVSSFIHQYVTHLE